MYIDPHTGIITFRTQTEINDFSISKIMSLETRVNEIIQDVKSIFDVEKSKIDVLESVITLQRARINQLESRIERLENRRG